jgi:TRAP-type C4-dicarboxylate transport system permease small subunit
MLAFGRLLKAVSRFAGLVGVAAILALMLLTVVTVIFRAIGIAFPGTYVLAELLLIPAVSISIAYAAMANEHTRVDLFVGTIKNLRLRRVLHGVMLALGSLFWMAITWATIREAIRRGAQGETSPIINVPVSPFRWTMAAALVLLCVILVWQSVKLLRGQSLEDPSHNLETEQ